MKRKPRNLGTLIEEHLARVDERRKYLGFAPRHAKLTKRAISPDARPRMKSPPTDATPSPEHGPVVQSDPANDSEE
jgi:hypothetical protein